MRSQMPRTYALAQKYGYATNYQAITHPSLPNYLTIASGDTHGVTDDNPPSDHPLQGPSIFARALTAGKTAGLYADAMPSPCDTSSSGTYAVKHNPWAYFPAERADCQKYDVPVSALDTAVSSGSLPNVGMVVPDLCNDAHDCPLGTADTWITSKVATVMHGPDWASGHLAIVITADEDDGSAVPDTDNRVLTVVIHPSQNHHVVTTALSHKSLYGLYEDVIGVPHTESSSVGSMAQAFGLPLAH
jgi:acid phosphatase